jgi:uncharacterized membrane protein YuzA (DUF378 family)
MLTFFRMASAQNLYWQKMANKMATVFLVGLALNYGLVGLNRINLLERLLGKGTWGLRAMYLLVGVAALSMAFNRDTYLPFLGETHFPCSLLQEQTPPGATRSVQVRVEPNAKVLYWATEPSDGSVDIKPYDIAYGGYKNAGVAIADHNGFVNLKVREPQDYKVPLKGRLEQHIHFRTCSDTPGFIGRIKTVYVKDGRVEGFVSY